MPAAAATRNVAGGASAAASNEPIPTQYWIRALNDGKVRKNPLPPEMWGSCTGRNPARPLHEYRWQRHVPLTGSRHWCFTDPPADRKRVAQGKSGDGRADLGTLRNNKTKKSN